MSRPTEKYLHDHADVLLPLWEEHREALNHPIRTFEFPRFGRVFDDRPYQLGVINLSRDSSYRESIAHDVPAAVYAARRMTVEGAVMIDVGAESSGESAELLDIDAQLSSLLPVVRAITDEGMMVSAETYYTDVAVAALEAEPVSSTSPAGSTNQSCTRRSPATRRPDPLLHPRRDGSLGRRASICRCVIEEQWRSSVSGSS